jgi:hypothetical protein
LKRGLLGCGILIGLAFVAGSSAAAGRAGQAPRRLPDARQLAMKPIPVPSEAASPFPGDTTLSAEMSELKGLIRSVITHYQTRQLNTRDHTPWEAMHAFVAFNTDTQVRRDGPNGPPVSAIGWVLQGGRFRGQQLLTLEAGRPHAEEGVGVQGHAAQLLAILAQSGVSPESPMRVGGKDFTVQDLIEEEMATCRAGTELTFKLISLSHYLHTDDVWRSRDGETWSIPRLLNEEIKSPIRGAACGGTHRLFGIGYAYQMRERDGLPVDGEYARARQYIHSYHRYAWSLQNPDGSFSTEWFARRGNRPDLDRKLQTTGHILEWLVQSVPDDQLQDPKMIKSVEFVATALAGEPNRAWSIGPLGHALHALVLYDARVFGSSSSDTSDTLAGTKYDR